MAVSKTSGYHLMRGFWPLVIAAAFVGVSGALLIYVGADSYGNGLSWHGIGLALILVGILITLTGTLLGTFAGYVRRAAQAEAQA
jgi:hypothetical protein